MAPWPAQSSPAPAPSSAGDYDKELVLIAVVVEKRSSVEDVGGAAGEEGGAWAEDVVDPAAKHAEYG